MRSRSRAGWRSRRSAARSCAKSGSSAAAPGSATRSRSTPSSPTTPRAPRPSVSKPRLLTFDLFGTVVDWRTGLRDAVAAHGLALDEAVFERVIDAQGADEQAAFRPYVETVARSPG